ncbi:GTPase-activating protein [Irineochytrium annulatum]|nr:GTPase-activating protein [Irineochytrium annulatum]
MGRARRVAPAQGDADSKDKGEDGKAVAQNEDQGKKLTYFDLFRYADGTDKALMAVGLVFSVCTGASTPLTTVLFGDMINIFSDNKSPSKDPTQRANIVAGTATTSINFILIAAFAFVSSYIYMTTWIVTGARITHRTRENYLKAVLRQDVGWHDGQGAGEVATRITTDMGLIQDAISEKVPTCLSLVFTFVTAFCIALYRSYRMTLVLMSVIPLLVLSVFFIYLTSSKYQKLILGKYSLAGTVAEETIASLRTVTAFNAQGTMSGRYGELLGGATGMGIRKGIIVNVFFAVLIGSFSLGGIAPDLQAIAVGTAAGKKIFATLDRVPPIDTEAETGVRIPDADFKGRIVFDSVDFTYPLRPDVKILYNFSLTVEPGTTVALVGESGSGKSTIIQLLERFYNLQGGGITIDGVPIDSLNVTWLRHHIGLVSQEPTLFEGTVYDNIAQGLIGTPHESASRDIKLPLVMKACVEANAHDFILKLPQGYDTPVGERGLLLSGGQKQRIAIARAIVKDPRVLLLDEATSALDTTSERVVQAALDGASRGRTTVVIAHRLSTVRKADRIVCMIRGVVVESGTHNELLEKRGFYWRLVEAQQLNQNEEEEGDVLQAIKSADGMLAVQPVALVAAVATEQNGAAATSAVSLLASKADLQSGQGNDLEAALSNEEYRIPLGRVLKFIFELSKPELAFNILGWIFAFVMGTVQPVISYGVSSFIQAFSEPEPQRTTDCNYWAVMFVITALAAFVSCFFQNASFSVANERLTERIRRRLFTSILRQNVAFFDESRHSTGVLTSNLAVDAQKIQGAAGVTLATVLQLIATLLGGICIAFANGWKLTLVACLLIPLLIFAGSTRQRITGGGAGTARKSYERSAQIACESVAGIRTVQSLTRERKIMEDYREMLGQPFRDEIKGAVFGNLLYSFSQSVSFLGNALLFWYGGQLIAYEGYSVKQFFVVFMAVIFGAQSASRIFSFIPDFSKAMAATCNIMRVLDRQPAIDSDSATGEDVGAVNGKVEITDVRFHYPTRPNVKVLRGLNITVHPGEFVGLVGPSGCGKSTVIGLLERFYDPVSGAVKLDGVDIRDLNIKKYRSAIGLVSQEPNLFDLSIEDNIAFGCDVKPTREQIVKAATEANIHNFIMGLPEQYATKVGTKGSQLSGGQKQRIAIARALVRNPKVLLLDEATSALDAESERVVEAALDSASKGRTTIAIAHRLSSIQKADVIYVLKDGRVAESGNHQQLYDQRGLYYELVIQQALDKDKK